MSTAKNPIFRQFDVINATSAAAAQASWFAAHILYKYPNLWPESIRGLMIHSAKWSDNIIDQFNIDINRKQDVKELRRICGCGTPSLSKALYSTENGLTFIIQEELQPFAKTDTRVTANEMHFYELPWPKEELLANPNVEVKVKITLSYFIEPGPGEVGWKDKYRYFGNNC